MEKFRPSRRRFLGFAKDTAILAALNSACGPNQGSNLEEPLPGPTATLAPVMQVEPENHVYRDFVEFRGEEKESFVYNMQPISLTISKLGINDLQVNPAKIEGGTFKVPDDGSLVTPDFFKDPDLSNFTLKNKLWIAAHSRWENELKLFSKLQNLELGDDMRVDAILDEENRIIKDLRFNISEFVLTDTKIANNYINTLNPDNVPEKPLLILQTSVRSNGYGSNDGPKEWILDRNLVMRNKPKEDFTTTIDDPNLYLILFVMGSISTNIR